MDKDEYHSLDASLTKCKDIDIDVRLRQSAEVKNLRLMHELKIKDFLKAQDHHDNFKEIMKDIKQIKKMVADA